MNNSVDKNGKVIAFMNMKGGVGKTTLCLSLGEYLARFKDKKILFIDTDPQFNLTQTFLREFEKEDEYLSNTGDIKTIYHLYSDSNTPKVGEPHIQIKAKELIITLDKNIDIIYGQLELIKITFSEKNKYLLNKFIKDNDLRKKYDFIFLDCPPTISIYTSSAMHSSDYYIIPNRLDRYSMLGIKLLKDAIDMEGFDSDRTIEMQPLGIIFTMVTTEPTKRGSDLMAEFEKSLIASQITTFKNSARTSNHLVEGKQGNIMSKYQEPKKDIKAIALEFLDKLAKKENIE